MSRSRPPRHSSILTPRGLEGCILFLKRMRDIHRHYLEQYYLEPSVFWHPALVLHTDESSNEATICILNTLNDCNAEDCFPLSDCNIYLALWPKHPPLPSQPQLNLQRNATLRKPGYINIRREYLIHQSMLQPYDWNQPTNYYRLTQKSFTVVTAKLDTIYYANRLAKLNAEDFARQLAASRAKGTAAKAAKLDAEILALLTAKEALSDSKHSKRHLAAEAVNLDADIVRFMADWDSLPSQSRSDCQLEKRTPLVAVTTEAIRVRSETPTSFGKIRLLISVILLAAAIIWTRSRVDSAQGVWLVKEFFKILVQVLVVTLAMSWELGKYIATGLGMLGNPVAAWVGGFLEKIWNALMQVSMAAWETWETGLLIEAVDRSFGKAFKALIDGGGLHDGLDA